jgi:hypothetical protein
MSGRIRLMVWMEQEGRQALPPHEPLFLKSLLGRGSCGCTTASQRMNESVTALTAVLCCSSALRCARPAAVFPPFALNTRQDIDGSTPAHFHPRSLHSAPQHLDPRSSGAIAWPRSLPREMILSDDDVHITTRIHVGFHLSHIVPCRIARGAIVRLS